jgi:chaperonin GroES
MATSIIILMMIYLDAWTLLFGVREGKIAVYLDRRRAPTGSCRGTLESALCGRSNMKVVPLGDKVVIKRLDADGMTTGGIILPDTAKEKPQQGRVLSVGDGRLMATGSRIPHEVSEGDRVLFPRWAGTEVSINGQDLLILSEEEILAISK